MAGFKFTPTHTRPYNRILKLTKIVCNAILGSGLTEADRAGTALAPFIVPDFYRAKGFAALRKNSLSFVDLTMHPVP